MSNSFWNEVFAQMTPDKVAYDSWLGPYQAELEKARLLKAPVLDLGCGAGNNTLYLAERGIPVISCDLSEEALRCVERVVPGAVTRQVDLTEPLPFETAETQVVLADLCLHYFGWEETQRVVKELKRVLRPGGVLLCRVNSTMDGEYGAGAGIQLEENFYAWQGQTKRFFDAAQVERLFADWMLEDISEQILLRYDKPKHVWQLAARKK
jgi:SAM-dependent methyltransferase